jgi:hypothetical protein
LENYFIKEFCLDFQLQKLKGDPGHEGPVFEQAYREMRELGYNPYEIQQIIFKGFDLALKKNKEEKEAQARLKEYKLG